MLELIQLLFFWRNAAWAKDTTGRGCFGGGSKVAPSRRRMNHVSNVLMNFRPRFPLRGSSDPVLWFMRTRSTFTVRLYYNYLSDFDRHQHVTTSTGRCPK